MTSTLTSHRHGWDQLGIKVRYEFILGSLGAGSLLSNNYANVLPCPLYVIKLTIYGLFKPNGGLYNDLVVLYTVYTNVWTLFGL